MSLTKPHTFLAKLPHLSRTTPESLYFLYCQILGWAGLSVISFFSLNLWYNQPESTYLIHNVLQSIIGIVVSWPMRHIFQKIWHYPLTKRLIYIAFNVLFFSLIWTIVRVYLFVAMTSEGHVWLDFGGWYYASMFIFMCWAALYHGLKYSMLSQRHHKALIKAEQQRRNEQLQKLKAQSETKEAQLKMLRYQLNPHFLFNTLNAISSLIQYQDTKLANTMLINLSEFLRYSLDNNPKQQVTVAEEIEMLQLYLKIEKVRFDQRLTVNIDISDDALIAKIPSLLLQPLIENSIKYAITPAINGGCISIIGYCENKQLVIKVSDSGKGFQHQQQLFSGIGLSNTVERLETLYGNNYSFNIENISPTGLQITLRLPLY